ncbi:hypothetical protein E2C01_035121 [Portunus trituberculatus]|uniref:Uncharacterized protein n=1 Tax=Portunus trituberculatus TaxID=210409 RepID=A0A5B7FAL5_PORTR|nr:hypothetical protein [Portunus trituberculatus]
MEVKQRCDLEYEPYCGVCEVPVIYGVHGVFKGSADCSGAYSIVCPWPLESVVFLRLMRVLSNLHQMNIHST